MHGAFRGFGFVVAAFLLQVFASDPSTLMFARALAGVSVGIYPGALITMPIIRSKAWEGLSLGSLSWMVGFFTAGLIGVKNGPAFCVFCLMLCFLLFTGF